VTRRRPARVATAYRRPVPSRSSADLDDLQRQALVIRDLYDELNMKARGRVWTREEFMLGFVGDVGDLAKLAMAADGARDMPGGQAALGHELADCLWCVLVLAHLHEVDLPAEFERTMHELNDVIRSQLNAGAGPSSNDEQ
jgi:NTP pyrophosphatase (non-canonical NTP hydrolase)